MAMNREKLDSFITEVPVAAFDGVASHAYAAVRMAYKARTRDALDKLIAAHAIALGVTLVTNNTEDFIDCPTLVVENWVQKH